MHVSYTQGSCTATVAAAGQAPAAAGSTVIYDDAQQLTYTILRPMKPDKAAHKTQMSALDQQISLDKAQMKKIKALLQTKPIAGHVAAGRVGARATEQVLYSIPALKTERERLRQQIHDLRKQRHDIRSAYKKAWHVYGKEEQAWRVQQMKDRRRTCTTCAQAPDTITHSSSTDPGRKQYRRRCPLTAVAPVRPERAAVRFGHRSRGRGSSSSSRGQPAAAAVEPCSVVHNGASDVAAFAVSEVGRNGDNANGNNCSSGGSTSSGNSGVLDQLDLSGVLGSAGSPAPFRHYPAIPGFAQGTAAHAALDDTRSVSSSSSDSSSSSSSSDDSDVAFVSSRSAAAAAALVPQQMHVAAGAQQSGQEQAVDNPFAALQPFAPVIAPEPAVANPAAGAANRPRGAVDPVMSVPVPAPAPVPAAAAAAGRLAPPPPAAAAGGAAHGSLTVAITGGGAAAERLTCIVCLDAPRSVLLLPCKHLVLCEGCARDLQETATRGADSTTGRRSRRLRRGTAGRRRSRPVAGAEVPGTVVRVLWQVWFGRGRDNDNHSDTDSVFSGVSGTASSSRDRGVAAAGGDDAASGCLSCPVCRVPVEQQLLVYT